MLLHGIFEILTLNHNSYEYLTISAAVGHKVKSYICLQQWSHIRNRPYCVELQDTEYHIRKYVKLYIFTSIIRTWSYLERKCQCILFHVSIQLGNLGSSNSQIKINSTFTTIKCCASNYFILKKLKQIQFCQRLVGVTYGRKIFSKHFMSFRQSSLILEIQGLQKTKLSMSS